MNDRRREADSASLDAAMTILGIEDRSRAAHPATLLGLSQAPQRHEDIDQALRGRLAQVDAHRLRATPDAEDVRLALYAAAAQLGRDAASNAAVVTTPTERVARVERVAQRPQGATAAVPARAVLPVRPAPATGPIGEDADSNRSVRDLLLGVGATLVVVLMCALGVLLLLRPGTPTLNGANVGTAPGTPRQMLDETVSDARDPQTSDPSAAASGEATQPDAPEGTTASPAELERVAIESLSRDRAPAPDPTDPRSGVRGLQRVTALARSNDPSAIAALVPALSLVADWWVDRPSDVRGAEIDSVVELAFASGRTPELARVLTAALSEWVQAPGPGRLWRAAWAGGVLARLDIERELPTEVAAGVRDALARWRGGGRSATPRTFEQGAVLASERALSGAIRMCTQDAVLATATTNEWVRVVQATLGGERARMNAGLLDELERLLLEGAEPDADAGMFAALQVLTRAIDWRAGSPSRPRLLGWFLDQRVSVIDLHVITITLSTSSSDGVPAELVLSIGADADQREIRAIELAQAWSLADAGTRAAALADLRTVAVPFLSRIERHDSPTLALADAALASRLVTAAQLVWLGDISGATSVTASVRSGLTLLTPGATPGPSPALPRMGLPASQAGSIPGMSDPPGPEAWAERFLAAQQSTPRRLELLGELEHASPPISVIDAAVLVDAALMASPARVRTAAQQRVMAFSSEVSILDAALKQLSLAPKVPSVSRMYERLAATPLGKPSDPNWEIVARRELLRSLIALTTRSVDSQVIDDASAMIVESYERRGVIQARTTDPFSERAITAAAAGVRRLRSEASALTIAQAEIDDIDVRLQSGLAMADAPIQRFVAYQRAQVQLLAEVVAHHMPPRAEALAQVTRDLPAKMRECRHAFEQMWVLERASLAIWIERLGGEAIP
jgi:hypothetical protein